jgi:uncharacterized protein YjiS (DUF1127 family)
MTDIAPPLALRDSLSGADIAFAIQIGWRAWRHRRQLRRQMARLARLGPRLLTNIGCDPEAVQAALASHWDDPIRARFTSFPAANRPSSLSGRPC